MNTWKQNIVPPKSLKVNLNLQISTMPIPIKAREVGEGKARTIYNQIFQIISFVQEKNVRAR